MAPKKSGSPKSKPLGDAARAKAYKEYYSTLDKDTLAGMCKDAGHDTNGTKGDLIERLSKPRGNRARSGSPIRMVTDKLLAGKNLTKTQESAVFAGAVAVLLIALVLAGLFYKEGGDANKVFDHLGPVGATLKGFVGTAKTAAASATGKK